MVVEETIDKYDYVRDFIIILDVEKGHANYPGVLGKVHV
jgi:hypothetical protein